MPMNRTIETAEERGERLKEVTLRARDRARAADDALDARVRQNIKLHGA